MNEKVLPQEQPHMLKNRLLGSGHNLSRRERTTLRMVQMAMLAGVSVALVLMIRIPMFLPFLEYDMADVPVLIAAFAMGPASGLTVLLLVSVIQAFLLGGNGWIGLFMHFIATGSLLLVAALVYRAARKTTFGLVLGLAAGALAMTAMMIPLNFIFIPKLSFDVPLTQSVAMIGQRLLGLESGAALSEMAGVAFDTVKGVLLTAIIPFNLIKAGLNSAIFFIIYKSLRAFLERRTQA